MAELLRDWRKVEGVGVTRNEEGRLVRFVKRNEEGALGGGPGGIYYGNEVFNVREDGGLSSHYNEGFISYDDFQISPANAGLRWEYNPGEWWFCEEVDNETGESMSALFVYQVRV